MQQDPSSAGFISNPYSTRFVAPGAMEFVFSDGERVELLVERLRSRNWWGQIVGPHGSGKSTLVHSMMRHLKEVGREIELVRMGSQSRGLPLSWHQAKAWSQRTQVIVDGYEQLSWLSRIWLKRACRARRSGLLVTTHRDAKLPNIYTAKPSLPVAKEIVTSLDRNATAEDIERINDLFARHDGNMRELLFELYDHWEHQRRRAKT